MIRAVIFDLGGVVLRFTNGEYYRHLAKISGKPYGFVYRAIEEGSMVPLEAGTIGIKEFNRSVAKRLGITSEQVVWNGFYKKTVKLDYDVLELIEELQKEYITAFLTNADAARYRYTTKILDLDLFDYRFQSCYIGVRKPDSRIYKYALKRMGLKPEEAVFIDDRTENVRAARRLGMHAVQFKSRRLLDRELAKLNL